MLLEFEQLSGHADLGLQEVLGVHGILGRVAGVLLDIQANGGAAGSSARQAHDDTAARREAGVEALVGRDGAVEIGVGEVAGLGDGAI